MQHIDVHLLLCMHVQWRVCRCVCVNCVLRGARMHASAPVAVHAKWRVCVRCTHRCTHACKCTCCCTCTVACVCTVYSQVHACMQVHRLLYMDSGVCVYGVLTGARMHASAPVAVHAHWRVCVRCTHRCTHACKCTCCCFLAAHYLNSRILKQPFNSIRIDDCRRQ